MLCYFLDEKKEGEVASENDYYFQSSNAIGKLEIYFDKNGRPLIYYAEFLLHFTSFNGSTRVDIITINPEVVVGQGLLQKLRILPE